jgi:hypothetical protein
MSRHYFVPQKTGMRKGEFSKAKVREHFLKCGQGAQNLQAAKDASEMDRAFFEANPHRSIRARLALPGELPEELNIQQPIIVMPEIPVIIVYQARKGVRLRIQYPINLPGAWAGEVTNELLDLTLPEQELMKRYPAKFWRKLMKQRVTGVMVHED